jgi:pSer/pThr/pTyr-binding forkhead associated (FHA) protein
LQLQSKDISGRQLLLLIIAGRLYAVHISDRVPTLWGSVAQPSGWVDADTILTIGPFTLRFPNLKNSVDPNSLPANSPMAAGSWPGQPVTLELRRGQSSAVQANINRIVTLVGNLPSCKLRLNSSRVSSIHCALLRNDDGLWVVDLVSREGVIVNGNSVRAKLLADGDNLNIGGRELTVRYPKDDEIHLTNEATTNAPDGVSFGATELAVIGNRGVSTTADGADATVADAIRPLIDGLSAAQPQNVEQFRVVIAAMMQAFGMMYGEHRKFVQEEMTRLDELTRAIAERHAVAGREASANANNPQQQPKPKAPDLSIPLPPLSASPPADQVHAWLQQRIEEMGEKRSSFWDRIAALLRTNSPETRGS